MFWYVQEYYYHSEGSIPIRMTRMPNKTQLCTSFTRNSKQNKPPYVSYLLVIETK